MKSSLEQNGTGMERQYLHKSDVYKEGRRGYSEKAVELIGKVTAGSGAVFADMGSGTGIFSADLLQRGYRVYGVEPDEALQKKAVERLRRWEGFTAVTAPAEETRLPAHSVDGITAASAFHWFQPEAFLQECKRIGKPDSHVFLLYNVRKTDDPFSREQERVCRRYCPAFTSFRHGADKAKARCQAFFSKGYKEKRYPHDFTYTKEQFLARCLSSSYSLNRTQPDYAAYCRELEALIERYCTDGLITVPNDTAVWYGAV